MLYSELNTVKWSEFWSNVVHSELESIQSELEYPEQFNLEDIIVPEIVKYFTDTKTRLRDDLEASCSIWTCAEGFARAGACNKYLLRKYLDKTTLSVTYEHCNWLLNKEQNTSGNVEARVYLETNQVVSETEVIVDRIPEFSLDEIQATFMASSVVLRGITQPTVYTVHIYIPKTLFK